MLGQALWLLCNPPKIAFCLFVSLPRFCHTSRGWSKGKYAYGYFRPHPKAASGSVLSHFRVLSRCTPEKCHGGGWFCHGGDSYGQLALGSALAPEQPTAFASGSDCIKLGSAALGWFFTERGPSLDATVWVHLTSCLGFLKSPLRVAKANPFTARGPMPGFRV